MNTDDCPCICHDGYGGAHPGDKCYCNGGPTNEWLRAQRMSAEEREMESPFWADLRRDMQDPGFAAEFVRTRREFPRPDYLRWWYPQAIDRFHHCKCRCQRWYSRRCGRCWCGR